MIRYKNLEWGSSIRNTHFQSDSVQFECFWAHLSRSLTLFSRRCGFYAATISFKPLSKRWWQTLRGEPSITPAISSALIWALVLLWFSGIPTIAIWISRSVCALVLRFLPLFLFLLSNSPVYLYSSTIFAPTIDISYARAQRVSLISPRPQSHLFVRFPPMGTSSSHSIRLWLLAWETTWPTDRLYSHKLISLYQLFRASINVYTNAFM